MDSNADKPLHAPAGYALKDGSLRYRCASEAYTALLTDAVGDAVERVDRELLPVGLAQRCADEDAAVLGDGVALIGDRPLATGQRVLRLALADAAAPRAVGSVLVAERELAEQLLHWLFPAPALERAQRTGSFAVLSEAALLFHNGDARRRQRMETLLAPVRRQLPPAARRWLGGAAAPIGADHRGQLALSVPGVGRLHVLWSLLRWGRRPALAVCLFGAGPRAESAAAADGAVTQAALDGAAQGFVLLGREALLLADDNAARLLAYRGVGALLAGGEPAALLPRELAAQLAGQPRAPFSHRGHWRGAGDHLRAIECRALALQWDGEPAWLLYLNDAARRSRVQAERRRNQRRFQDFAELAADYFWELDRDLRFSFLSHRFESVLQIERQEVMGLSIRQFCERYFPQPTTPAWRRHLGALDAREAQRAFEFRWTRRDGSERVIVHTCQPIRDEVGTFEGYRGVGHDVTRDRQLAAKAHYHATHDALTGLVNRREFERLLEDALQDAHSSDARHALCFVDLDRFKVVNDSCGHSAGDELLRQLGDLFRERLRQSDVIGRLGGDEFGILIYSCEAPQARELAEKIRDAVASFTFLWEHSRFSIGASIGVAPIDQHTASVNAVMQLADAACYRAKDGGRNRVIAVGDGEGSASLRSDADRLIELRAIVERGEFSLWRQPILALDTGAASGDYFEILLRLPGADGQVITPGAVLPVIERYGLSAQLDRLVIDRCLHWLAAMHGQLDQLAMCHINISGPSLLDRALIDHLIASIRDSAVPANKLCFELSEMAAIAHLSAARSLIARLGRLGCHFALDNFGSGVSSFTFVRDLPIDFLKVHGDFVRGMRDDPVCEEMVRSIQRVGAVLGRSTIAESVEDEASLQLLESMGVNFAQGFHIGKPQPIDGL